MRPRRPVLFVSFLVLMLVAATILLTGRGGPARATSRTQPALALMPACADAALAFRLTTSSPIYLPGQPVGVRLEVRNTGADWCRVIGQCDEVATLSIFDRARLVWSDRPCYNHEWDAVPIALAPGRLVNYRGAWTPGHAHPGWYDARAAFLQASFLLL